MARCCGEREDRAFQTASSSSRASSATFRRRPRSGELPWARALLISVFRLSSNPTSLFQNEVRRLLPWSRTRLTAMRSNQVSILHSPRKLARFMYARRKHSWVSVSAASLSLTSRKMTRYTRRLMLVHDLVKPLRRNLFRLLGHGRAQGCRQNRVHTPSLSGRFSAMSMDEYHQAGFTAYCRLATNSILEIVPSMGRHRSISSL